MNAVSPRSTLWRIGSLPVCAGGVFAGAKAVVCTLAGVSGARSIAPPATVEISTGLIGPVVAAPVAGDGSATRVGRAIISPLRRVTVGSMPLYLARVAVFSPTRYKLFDGA